MPESRKRKKATDQRVRVKNPAAAKPGRYAVGKLSMPEERIGGILSDRIPPDLTVELLPAALWMYYASGRRANACVDGSMTLHYAYEHLGILAEPRPVELIVTDTSSGKETRYGRPAPYWTGRTFHGHCILWLPGSRRFIDATVEQYPEVRQFRLGPICGRTVAVHGQEEDRAALAGGTLVPGSRVLVQRQSLQLEYIATAAEHSDVVTSSRLVQETNLRYRRAGINLASLVLRLLQDPEVAERVRRAPYRQLHALLDLIGDSASEEDENGDVWFEIVGSDGTPLRKRLDDLEVALPPERAEPSVEEVMESVDAEACAIAPGSDVASNQRLPTLLVEPQQAVRMDAADGIVREAQAEAIIAAGFSRYLPNVTGLPRHLPRWSVRHTETGVELWDRGGIWARCRLTPDENWLAAAEREGKVLVIYGVRVGVCPPVGALPYDDLARSRELVAGREAGLVAAATVPWRSAPEAEDRPRGGWLRALLGRRTRTS